MIKNKSHAVTAEIVVPEGGRQRHDRRPGRRLRRLEPLPARTASRRTATTCSACSSSRSTATSPIPAGEHQVRVEFAYDGGGLGKGGTATLYVDGDEVGEGRVDATVPMVFSADETTDVGSDTGTPVTDDLAPPRQRLHRPREAGSQIDLGDDAEDADHLITPEERYRIAMARQ